MLWHDDGYVYHYTGARALLGIVQQRKIWATHSEFLNDGLEGKLIPQYLRNWADDPSTNFAGHAFTSEQLDAFKRHLQRGRLTYVASFSSRPNSLTQYRMYSPTTGGFAVGFPKEFLRKAGTLIEVQYDDQDHLRWCADYFLRYMGALALADGAAGPLDLQVDTSGAWLEERCLRGVMYKSSEFGAEEEHRIVVTGTSATNVRPSGNGSLLIPYVEIDLPNEAVNVRIAVGPGRYQTSLASMSIGSLTHAARSAGTRWEIGHLSIGESAFRGDF